jgi:four helix bundle protein
MKNEKVETAPDLSQRTKEFSLSIIRMVSSLPSSSTARVMGNQILRSGTSVGANYREANRARSKAEFIAKIGDCLKEIDETCYWLELLGESGTISIKKIADLLDESPQLMAIFIAILKRSKASPK